jgi:hypothetical protein
VRAYTRNRTTSRYAGVVALSIYQLWANESCVGLSAPVQRLFQPALGLEFVEPLGICGSFPGRLADVDRWCVRLCFVAICAPDSVQRLSRSIPDDVSQCDFEKAPS